MSQFPPSGQPVQPNYQMQPSKSNGWGLAALIFGILGFCTAGITGLFAIIFGFIGIKKSKVTQSGKGMSIAGLLLGLLSVVGAAIFFVTGGLAILGFAKISEAPRASVKQFLKDLDTGNVTAATADTDGTMTQTDIQSLSDELKVLGTVTDVTNVSFNIVNDAADLVGVVSFSNGTKKGYTVHEVKSGGTWKVSNIVFDLSKVAPSAGSATTSPSTP